ncbi:MAG: LysR substrate-binding domain-containing protein [Pseudomonadota bacterium]
MSRYLQDWLLEGGMTPGQIISVGSYLAILACVSAGTGYAVVPQAVLDCVSSAGEFVQYPLEGRYARIETLLAWRGNYTSGKLDALRELTPALEQ